ncbi:hypothetical protein [Aeromicrobium marinum]|uniref:hypothetical protein n=1 Tax=Aeromicrobium marinum TaxID=219314 RepID=UPI0001BCC8C9|nr:hypothetical protein [Aeromicrobium marinum]
MTTQPLAADAVLNLDADTDARLAQLHAAYPAAKAAADAAAAQLKVITDGIKAELAARAADHLKIQLNGPHAPSLRLSHSERWTVDAKKLKAEAPETYVRYAKKSESWSLTVVKGGGEDQ